MSEYHCFHEKLTAAIISKKNDLLNAMGGYILAKGDCIFKLSKQFAEAELIVVSAPYWDGQFPAIFSEEYVRY